MTGSIRIRDAAPADGRAIARVHVGSWATTYRGLFPEHQGRGIGRALLHEGLRRFQARGMRSMLIWVLRENSGARAFYERLGGLADREKHDSVGAPGGPRHPVTEIGYVWNDLASLVL